MCGEDQKNMVFEIACQLEGAVRLLKRVGDVEGKNCQRNWESNW